MFEEWENGGMGRRREEVVMVVSADVSVPLFEFWWMGMWMWDWGLLELPAADPASQCNLII
jgi:hypothetical protein